MSLRWTTDLHLHSAITVTSDFIGPKINARLLYIIIFVFYFRFANNDFKSRNTIRSMLFCFDEESLITKYFF